MSMTLWLEPVALSIGLASGPVLDHTVRSVGARRTGSEQAGTGEADRRFQRVALSATAGILEGLAALRFGASWTLLAYAVFLPGLAVLAWCDGRYFLLPKRIQHPVTAISGGLLLAGTVATGRWHQLLLALACGVVGFTIFCVLHVVNPKGLAFGDVRLAGSIALLVGWLGPRRTAVAFVLGSVLAAMVGIVLVASRRAGWRSRLPYGVFLAIGAAIAILA